MKPNTIRFGLDMPNMGACGSARSLADLAVEAEEAGWDGFFVWDTVYAEMDDPPKKLIGQRVRGGSPSLLPVETGYVRHEHEIVVHRNQNQSHDKAYVPST